MRKLPELYTSLAYKGGRYPLIKVELYEGERKNWTDIVTDTITGSDHVISATYSNGTTTQPVRFETGIAYCGELKLVLSGEYYNKIKNSQKMKVYAGFKDILTGDEVYVAVGVFFVEGNELIDGSTHITARDLMMYGETMFDGLSLSYPLSLTDLFKECVNQMGGKIPEGFVLSINPMVLSAPYIKSQYEYSDVSGNRYPGRLYTCRQIIAQIAKMQLGNAFVNGDGYVKMFGYSDSINVNDNRITELNISQSTYQNRVVIYQSNTELGNVQYIKDEDIYGTLVYNTFIPSENVDSGTASEELKAQLQKAKARRFYGGKIVQKGAGAAELGDWVEYSGKFGEKIFFASGVIMEWKNGSFDETIFSFSPTYETSVYTSSNTESTPSEVEDKADSSESGGSGAGVTIENAVVIQEADAKYLIHNYTEVEYIDGNKIVYTGPENPIIIQGLVCYASGSTAPNGKTIISTNGPLADVPDMPIYGNVPFNDEGLLSNNPSFPYVTGLSLYIKEAQLEYNVYRLGWATRNDAGETGDWSYQQNVYNNDCGVSFVWNKIFPAGTYKDNSSGLSRYFTYGYAVCRLLVKYKSSTGDWYTVSIDSSDVAVPFASEAEYNAAVGLTYSPNVLTKVQETVTEV